MPRRPRRSRLGGSRGVPVLVPVRASPVPSVVRGSFVVKFFSFLHDTKAVRATALGRWTANVLQNKLTRAQYLDEVTWTTKNWLGLQKQRISVVLHTAIAEQVVNELACGGGGRVHGAKCLATLAGVA